MDFCDINFCIALSLVTIQVIKSEDLQVVRELGLFDQGKLCEVDVAIRTMTHFSSRSSDDERCKFFQHAKILAELNHRNIAKVYGVIPVTQGGTPAVVFEYLDGPLREALSSENWNFGHQQKLLIAIDVAVAVEYLYRTELQVFCFDIDNVVKRMARSEEEEWMNSQQDKARNDIDSISDCRYWHSMPTRLEEAWRNSEQDKLGNDIDSISDLIDWDREDEETKNLRQGLDEDWMYLLRKSRTITNETVEEVKQLGSGAFGIVYLGKWGGQDVAIKRIKSSAFHRDAAIAERLKLEFLRESKVLSSLTHTNVVKLYGVIQDGPGGTQATVMEYIKDGTLRDVLHRKSRSLTRHQQLCLATDVADGMEYLHSEDIVHFDLKSANIFVDMTNPLRPVCKIGDLGLSKVNKSLYISSGMRGTLPWMAPELLNGSNNDVSGEVDVYSFGTVLWEIVTGKVPYADMDFNTIVEGVGKNGLRPPVPSDCDPELEELMEKCWDADPRNRPSFFDVSERLHFMLSGCTETPWNGLEVIEDEDVRVVRALGLFDHGKLGEVDVAIRRFSLPSPYLYIDEKRKFLRRAKIFARLNHRNIAKFYCAIDVQGEKPGVVIEYLDGPLREALISEKWNLSHEQKLLIAIDVAVALDYLHGTELLVFSFTIDHVFVDMTNPLRPICKLALFDLGLDPKEVTIPLFQRNQNEEAKKIHVERFGDFLFEIITGKNARAEANRLDRPTPVLPESCDPIWRELIEDCWSTNPSFTIIIRRLKFMSRANPAINSNGATSYEVVSLLSSCNREYLIRSCGFPRIRHVSIDYLKGKMVGLYFSGLWCDTSQEFTAELVELYSDLAHRKENFEVVFVSIDSGPESFDICFNDMPWLAIPYSDSDTMGKLEELFDVSKIPMLVILDENGSIVSKDGVEIVRNYGIEAYPFTEERVKELVKAMKMSHVELTP